MVTTVAQMIDILSQFPGDLEVVTIVDAVPKDELSFDNYETEPEILYISR